MRIMGLDRKLGSNRDNTSIVTTNFSISTKYSEPYTYLPNQSNLRFEKYHENDRFSACWLERVREYSDSDSKLAYTIFLISWKTSCFQVKKLGSWSSTIPPRLNRTQCVGFLGFSFKVICNILFETGIDAKIKAQRWPNKFAKKYSTTTTTTEKYLWRFKWCKQIVVSTNHISVRQYLRCFVWPMKICASSAEYRIFEKSKHSQLFKNSQTKIDANKPSLNSFIYHIIF